MNNKFAKTSILGKPVLQPLRFQSVFRQPAAFKSERPRISKPQFASQVDVNNDLSKPPTTHYLPKEREYAVVKPHHVIASSESRNSSKNMLRFGSNDMVHNQYLDESKKKTQEKVNSRAKVPSHKTTQRYKPVEQIIVVKKQERWIPIRHRWVTIEKIFTSSTITVDSKPPHGSNTDITNIHECIQTLDSSADTSINVQEEQNIDLSTGTPFNQKKERIKARIKENVISGRSSKYGESIASALEDLTPAGNHVKEIIYKVNLPDHRQRCQGRLLASFQDDAKYKHVGQDTRSQDGKDDKDKQGKDLKISELKTKSKENDKGLRSKITKHEGTSIQHNKDQRLRNLKTKQSQQSLTKQDSRFHPREFKDHTLGEIVSLKYVYVHGSSESVGYLHTETSLRGRLLALKY
uniref:Uncharacterized protein n=1 Tax=Tanacetum cinerariifolium TaxID=118510 RepID=A0A699H3H1_TANCI|nr:hypothetical protein [Tanacetum cinerariifolium]